jgi:DNA-binding HxlR family transcriptional regulator
MMQEELREIIAIDENFRIELTTSTGDMDKFQEAICAFANDMPGSRKKGYLTAFSVVVKDEEETNCSPTVHQLFTNLSQQSKSLIISLKEGEMSVSELQLVTNCSPQSKRLFIKQFIVPPLETGIIERTHPENPHHPQQKYFLTELGKAVLELLMQQKKR